MSMQWTTPYCGVTHCGELTDDRRATVTDFTSFAVLTKWAKGMPLTRVQQEQYADIDAAKAAGEEWILAGHIRHAAHVDRLAAALADVLAVFIEGRNYDTKNPYTRPEVRAGLQTLQSFTGASGDWHDALRVYQAKTKREGAPC